MYSQCTDTFYSESSTEVKGCSVDLVLTVLSDGVYTDVVHGIFDTYEVIVAARIRE